MSFPVAVRQTGSQMFVMLSPVTASLVVEQEEGISNTVPSQLVIVFFNTSDATHSLFCFEISLLCVFKFSSSFFPFSFTKRQLQWELHSK